MLMDLHCKWCIQFAVDRASASRMYSYVFALVHSLALLIAKITKDKFNGFLNVFACKKVQ